ncbi:MAG TPA: hypothetical protein VNX46_03550 [Candidatus Acidoferrum sp.]|nr:hypothetical protein [Candidatus Acidoferrum sp.]
MKNKPNFESLRVATFSRPNPQCDGKRRLAQWTLTTNRNRLILTRET